MAELGDRIKYLREKKGLTQQEFIEKANLTIVQISRYETNDRKPDPDALGRIADVLDTNVDYLLGRTNFDGPTSKNHSLRTVEGIDIKLLEKLKLIAEERGYDLNEPRFLELVVIAMEIASRIKQKELGQS